MRDDTTISATEPNWSRETPRGWWDPGCKLLRALRRHQALEGRKGLGAKLMRRWWKLQHQIWSVATQCEIPLGCNIGGGLKLTHPNGVVIHPKAVIGPNCLIFHQVTIGQSRGGVPRIGGHVDIAAGAKIMGPVTIGDHAMIGVNSVVLSDVPPCGVAVGAPARVVRFRRIGAQDEGEG